MPLPERYVRPGAFTQKDEKTVVPLTLEPYGSMFVVFHKKIDRNKQGAKAGNDPDYEILQTLDGAWTVNFDLEWGGPSSVVFPGINRLDEAFAETIMALKAAMSASANLL